MPRSARGRAPKPPGLASDPSARGQVWGAVEICTSWRPPSLTLRVSFRKTPGKQGDAVHAARAREGRDHLAKHLNDRLFEGRVPLRSLNPKSISGLNLSTECLSPWTDSYPGPALLTRLLSPGGLGSGLLFILWRSTHHEQQSS